MAAGLPTSSSVSSVFKLNNNRDKQSRHSLRLSSHRSISVMHEKKEDTNLEDIISRLLCVDGILESANRLFKVR